MFSGFVLISFLGSPPIIDSESEAHIITEILAQFFDPVCQLRDGWTLREDRNAHTQRRHNLILQCLCGCSIIFTAPDTHEFAGNYWESVLLDDPLVDVALPRYGRRTLVGVLFANNFYVVLFDQVIYWSETTSLSSLASASCCSLFQVLIRIL